VNINRINDSYTDEHPILKSNKQTSFIESLETVLVGLLLFYFINPPQPGLFATLINAATYGVTTLLIIWRWRRFLSVATRDIPLLILFVMIGISGLWSALPDSTELTAKAVQRAMLIGVYLASRYSLKEQMRILSWVLGIISLVSLFVSLGLPSMGRSASSGAWQGIFLYKNHFAIFMNLAASLFLLNYLNHYKCRYKYRWFGWIGFMICTIMIFLSLSKSNYVIFLISIFLLPLRIFVKQEYKLQVILIGKTFLFAGLALFLVFNNLESIVVDTLGKNLEFNGRTPIWELCIELGLKRPWLGYGIAGFWGSRESLLVQATTWAGSTFAIDEIYQFNSHNGYLEVFLQLGLVGLSLYLLSLISTLKRTIHYLISTGSFESIWVLQTLIIICLYNFSDTGGTISRGFLWIIYISLAYSTHVWKASVKRNKRTAGFT
jgi:exopolysaccharide production protein ExoQ